MIIKIDEFTIEADFRITGSMISKFTNKQLSLAEISFVLYSKMESEIVNKVLQNGKEIFIGEEPNDKKWIIEQNSNSFTVGTTRYSYNAKIREFEQLNIEKLIIDDVEICPYNYIEEISSDALIIDFKVEGNPDTINKIRKMRISKKYYKVLRKGISDEIKTMRFGRMIEWSKNVETGIIHQMFNLVEDKYDQNNDKVQIASNLHIDKLINENIYLKEMIDYYGKILIKNKLINEADLAERTKGIFEDQSILVYDYYELDDID
jgi:hypothetical protein